MRPQSVLCWTGILLTESTCLLRVYWSGATAAVKGVTSPCSASQPTWRELGPLGSDSLKLVGTEEQLQHSNVAVLGTDLIGISKDFYPHVKVVCSIF